MQYINYFIDIIVFIFTVRVHVYTALSGKYFCDLFL